MQPQDEEPTKIADLIGRHKAKGYFEDGDGLIGVRSGGLVHWYRWVGFWKGHYRLSGTTKTPRGADYRKEKRQ